MRTWRDKTGKIYTDSEVVEKDIDTPGAQFHGFITRESLKKSNCIDEWVKVKPTIQKLDRAEGGE